MSDEVDTDWDNDTTVRLEFTRQSLKVISNKLSNSYSLSYCEFTLCSVLCAVPLKFSGFKFCLCGFLSCYFVCISHSQNFDSNNVCTLRVKFKSCEHSGWTYAEKYVIWDILCPNFIRCMYISRNPHVADTQTENPKSNIARMANAVQVTIWL